MEGAPNPNWAQKPLQKRPSVPRLTITIKGVTGGLPFPVLSEQLCWAPPTAEIEQYISPVKITCKGGVDSAACLDKIHYFL